MPRRYDDPVTTPTSEPGDRRPQLDRPPSEAERRIFEHLKSETPDSWIALHSLGLTRHRRKPWAEADFVVDGALFWGREHLADIKEMLTRSPARAG